MTKIAIISQPEQGVLIDIGGCDSLQEATQHLSSTFQVSNQFWENQNVDLNLGKLQLTRDELAQILAILSERGVTARQFFAQETTTVEALRAHNLQPSSGRPGETIPPPPLSATAATAEAGKMPAIPGPTATEAGSMPAPTATEAGSMPELPGTDGTFGTWGDGSVSVAEPVTAAVEAGSEPAATVSDTAPPLPAAPALPHVLYLRQTLRSGQSVTHKGHLVIIGDVNPGAEVMAEGDITIWGALRGIAHAGTAGNINSEIRALRFDPIQLRIAHAIARSPDRPKAALRSAGPETARIVSGTIRISSSAPE